jgi:hypothetical protein
MAVLAHSACPIPIVRPVDLEVKTPINLAEMYLGCEGRALPMGPAREPWSGAGQHPAKRKLWVIGLLSNKIRPRNHHAYGGRMWCIISIILYEKCQAQSNSVSFNEEGGGEGGSTLANYDQPTMIYH